MSDEVLMALADAVLAAHALFVLFVVGGLLLIPIGSRKGWAFVSHLWFRVLHLSAILVVIAESWLGMDCPLTTLENALRLEAGAVGYEASFIEYWVGGLLFVDAPLWVFTVVYTLFGALVMWTWWKFPPARGGKSDAA